MSIEHCVVNCVCGSGTVEAKAGSSMSNPILPLELIREILLWLPVRSVLRFKCVCKSWLSLISDSQFAISHYDLAASPSHRLLIRSTDFYVQSIDLSSPFYNDKPPLYFLLPPPSPPKPDQFNYYSDYHDVHEILGSCRGFVALYYELSADLILWNPSIGFHKRLPNFAYDLTSRFLYGFGYDTSTHDYLIVFIALYEYEPLSDDSESEDDDIKGQYKIFSVKANCWLPYKEINVGYKDLGYKFRAGSLVNEALHWLVFSKSENVPVIIAFDLKQRSLSEIPIFDCYTTEKYEVYSLRIMGGCLCVCCSVRGGEGVEDDEWAEIWVMKEYKVQSSWTKVAVIPVCAFFFSPICTTKYGILGSNMRGRLENLNNRGELIGRLIYGGFQGVFRANLQSAMYRESLLSLPSVIEGKK